LAQALQGTDSVVGVIAIDCTTRMRLNGEAEERLDGIYVQAYH
jgi:hypothetical protein